ncbi:hypothetical protein JOD18_002429 [Gracilibacillus alcaliphilus]|nr:hypothetical protein [Gracilibacillus alcaliphilus]
MICQFQTLMAALAVNFATSVTRISRSSYPIQFHRIKKGNIIKVRFDLDSSFIPIFFRVYEKEDIKLERGVWNGSAA